MSSVIIILFLIFAFVKLSYGKYGEDCVTPSDEEGKCVPLRSCSGAYEVFEKASKYGEEKFQDDISRLVQSKCKSFNEEPSVCCANEKIQINPVIYDHLKKQNCGHTKYNKVARGTEAGLFQFRWMVLLKYEGKEEFACGGSLIDDRHVLTAAHCLHNFTNIPIAVRLGEYNLNTEIDCLKYGKTVRCLDPVQDIEIENYLVHEDYTYRGKSHDIAILRLKRAVNLETKSIQTICLPISEQLQSVTPEEFQVAGWGRTEFGRRSNVLLYTSVPNRSHEDCQQSLGLTLSEEHICAGGREFHDTCKGDSGGPLFNPAIYVDGVLRVVQYGIVSLGALRCGEISVPAVYVSIPYYMQWITDHMIVDSDESPIVHEARSLVVDVDNAVSCLKFKNELLISMIFLVLLRSVQLKYIKQFAL